MSLLFNRGAIQRCVTGELSPRQELRLRDHLSKCPRCRDYYDRLSAASRALAAAPAGTRVGADRARARLEALLADPTPSPRPEQGQVRRWPGLIPAATLASALLVAGTVLLLRRPTDPIPAVAWRGGTGDAPAPAILVVHAKARDGSPVRLVAELPSSGEGRVRTREYVQFGLKDVRQTGFVAVVGIDARGDVHVYHPRDEARSIASGTERVSLGPSVDLSVGHPTGPLRLYLVSTSTPLTEPAILRAVGSDGGVIDLPGAHSVGVLQVEP